MFSTRTITFILGASISSLSFIHASPTPTQHGRAVTELNWEAFEEAHKRDAGATRAFSDVQIKTLDGQCLFIDELSGDFRANLTPIQVAACDGSSGQSWDVISNGIHNNAPGKVLVVNTLTQSCLDLNKGRVGREITTFSCGGRADGSGEVSRDQLFTVSDGSFSLTTDAADGTCLSVVSDQVLPANCQAGSPSQAFVIGQGGPTAPPENEEIVASSASGNQPTSIAGEVPATEVPCPDTTLITVTRASTSAAQSSTASSSTSIANSPSSSSSTSSTALSSAPAIVSSSSSSSPKSAAPTSSADAAPIQVNPTTPVPVSRAGGTLNPVLAAEAHTFDPSATRARRSISLRSSTTQDCLTINPLAGDFRQNLIPITFSPCSGAANQKFDIVTGGLHNIKGDQGKALVVSSLMNGCVNFDTRRTAGDKVMMFSCGGRAAGEGGTTDDQLFDFAGGEEIVLSQTKREGNVEVTSCLVPLNGELEDSKDCSGNVATYTFV